MKHRVLTLLALLAFLPMIPSAVAQGIQEQSTAPEPQQGNVGGDPIRQLNLTPEAELDADKPDEAVVEQRMREVGAAQAAVMRMRILTEVRIRRVLTVEQLRVLRNLRQQARQTERERIRDERQQQRRQTVDGANGLQNQRNEPAQQLLRRRVRPRP